jgi:hypothetical protein
MYKKKDINKRFFKKWSSEMAYILGFIFADGNILKNKRGANYFSFYSSDKGILMFIKKTMGSSHKVSQRNERSGNVYRIQVGRKEMVEDLYNLGLVETKARRMKFPNIPPKYLGSFILGFFDGDGNVWVGKTHKKRKLSTTTIQTAFTSASFNFLKELHKNLELLGVKGGFIYQIKNKNCSRLILSVNDSLKLYKIMYNGVCVPYCLRRKKKVFEKYIKMRL